MDSPDVGIAILVLIAIAIVMAKPLGLALKISAKTLWEILTEGR